MGFATLIPRIVKVGLPEYAQRFRVTATDRDEANFWYDTQRSESVGRICGLAVVRVPGRRRRNALSLATAEHRCLDQLFPPQTRTNLVYFEVVDAVAIGVPTQSFPRKTGHD